MCSGVSAIARASDTISDMNTLMAVDGTNLLHRSYHAMESTQMRDSNQQARWAIHGFVNLLAKHLDEVQPSSLIVAFDLRGGCPSRKLLAPSYKEGRNATPPELTEQLILLPQVLADFGVALGSVQDWEADDVLATAAQAAMNSGAEAVIVSSDKDAHQLIGGGVRVYKPEGIVMDEAALMAKYGIAGHRWVEYAAMIGEGADNLDGVMGIGPKRASALIAHFSDIEEAIANPQIASSIVGAKVADALVAGAGVFRRNRQVGTLRRDLDVDFSSVKLSGIDPEQIREVGLKYEIPAASTRLAGAVARRMR